MNFNLKEFLNKKVMVKLFNGQIKTGVILRGPDEGLFRFQYSTVESKSDDSYSGYYEETVLLSRRYTSDGLYIHDRLCGYSNRGWNIVDIQLTEEPKMTTTKLKFNIEPESLEDLWQTSQNYKVFAHKVAEMVITATQKKISNQWAKTLSDFIDQLGGDSPALWQWSGKTPTPEKVVECLRELVDFHMTTAADNELEASCEWLEEQLCMPENARAYVISKLRAARRPQPTLKSQALKDFETIKKNSDVLPEILETVEKALQSIPE